MQGYVEKRPDSPDWVQITKKGRKAIEMDGAGGGDLTC